MTLSAQQEQAFKAFKAWLNDPGRSPYFYLGGYAGTGKTYMAKTFAQEVNNAVFGAFTGKAALVMAGKGCEPSSTIHSLIYKPDEDKFGITHFILNKRDSAVKDADLVIIDEVSMVGEELGRDLLYFGKPVLVLGDPAQLPPVNDGSGFFMKGEPDFMLTEIHRQARDNPIIQMSMKVREGERLELGNYGLSRVIPRSKLGQKTVLDADQVLCGLNKTRRHTNAKIRRLLGHDQDGERFVVGERVVSLKNDSEKGLLNGSLWRVEEVEFSDYEETQMTLSPLDAGMGSNHTIIKTHHSWLEGKEKELPLALAKRYQPVDYGYCLSVHKAQGSQWDNVVIIDESFVFKQDRARHLYTAITRAAERVTVAV